MAKPKHNAPKHEVFINKLLSLYGRLEVVKNGENKPKRNIEVIENQKDKDTRS